ncbi:hypothetical protein LUZ60_005070 [Juncus effusus]|nr:hypothetical protein LUZ60_005070 [Juncus effusus]
MVSKGFVAPQNRDHIIAERKRREKLNQRFIELSSIIPYLKKSDKASVLIDAVKYVKELQTKVKTLESQNPKPIDTVVLVKTSSLSSDDANDKSSSSSIKPLPEIHAKLSENSVLISIHCENAKGVLVKILSEIEELNFTITQTNLIPFAASTALITITAQVEESCSITMEDLVRKLDSTLNQFKSSTNRKPMDAN